MIFLSSTYLNIAVQGKRIEGAWIEHTEAAPRIKTLLSDLNCFLEIGLPLDSCTMSFRSGFPASALTFGAAVQYVEDRLAEIVLESSLLLKVIRDRDPSLPKLSAPALALQAGVDAQDIPLLLSVASAYHRTTIDFPAVDHPN